MPETLNLTSTPTGVTFPIRVMPRAPKTELDGVREGRLLVRVTAPPVDRAANEAAVRAIADALGVPARSVTIAAGATARNKVVEVVGVTIAEVRARLSDRI